MTEQKYIPPICIFCGEPMTIERELKQVVMFECKTCEIGEARLKKRCMRK